MVYVPPRGEINTWGNGEVWSYVAVLVKHPDDIRKVMGAICGLATLADINRGQDREDIVGSSEV